MRVVQGRGLETVHSFSSLSFTVKVKELYVGQLHLPLGVGVETVRHLVGSTNRMEGSDWSHRRGLNQVLRWDLKFSVREIV